MIKFVPGEPALILKSGKAKHLVIADLHLGFEKELALKGVNIPSQTPRILSKAERIVEAHRPKRLIILGDVKHGTSRILPHEWLDIPAFFEGLLDLVEEISIIPGNHDGGLGPLLPRGVKMEDVRGLTIRDDGWRASLVHGHSWPPSEAYSSDVLIMGHHHFTVEFRDASGLRMVEQIWTVARWRREDVASYYLKSHGMRVGGDPSKSFKEKLGFEMGEPRIIVMPAFNHLLRGISINRRGKRDYLGPIFKSGGIDLSNSELYLLDGTLLGRLSDLYVGP